MTTSADNSLKTSWPRRERMGVLHVLALATIHLQSSIPKFNEVRTISQFSIYKKMELCLAVLNAKAVCHLCNRLLTQPLDLGKATHNTYMVVPTMESAKPTANRPQPFHRKDTRFKNKPPIGNLLHSLKF